MTVSSKIFWCAGEQQPLAPEMLYAKAIFSFMAGQGEEALAADGIVTAKVWGEGYGECALHEEWTEPSGNEVIALGIRVNNGSFCI